MSDFIEFEKPLEELKNKIEELRKFSSEKDVDLSEEIKNLEKNMEDMKKDIYQSLTPWQKVKIARFPNRPGTIEYIKNITDKFIELHGDRQFADDKSIIGGIGVIDGNAFTIIGHLKGKGTEENIKRNFGMPHPEGYRKAIRLMKQAEKFGRPIVTFIDTPGAFCGIGAEERGQGEAIAYNLLEMSRLSVPIIAIVIGEGGSGGALALGVGDRVAMLEHSIYSVISPEGLASILWKDAKKAEAASETMKLTSQDLKNLKIIDDIISEPIGGAHNDPKEMSNNIKKYISESIKDIKKDSIEKIKEKRYKKIREIGKFVE